MSLTIDQVREIFDMRFRQGMKPGDIADKIGISRSYACNILAARSLKKISWQMLREFQQEQYPELIEEMNRLRRENALLKSKLRMRITHRGSNE